MARVIVFSNSALTNLPSDGQQYADQKTPGLQVRCGKRAKVFYFVARKGVVVVFKKIGTFPQLGTSDARQLAREHRAEKSTANKSYKITLREVFDAFAAQKAQIKKTLKIDRRFIAGRLQAFADVPIQDITSSDLLLFRESMKDTPVYFNRHLALLSTLFNYAVRALSVQMFNPTLNIPAYQETPRDKHLDMSQMARFNDELLNLPTSTRDVIILLLGTAVRHQNATAAEWLEFDLDTATWRIPANKTKTNKVYVKHLPPDVVIMLQRRKASRVDQWVFPSPRSQSGHVEYIYSSFRKLCKLADLGDLRPHDIRRSIGTWLLNRGVPIAEVSQILDHNSIRTTEQVYARILPSTVAPRMNALLDEIKNS